MSAEKVNSKTSKETNVDVERREFMGKAGKYAAVGAGMATLMTPTLSTAGNYGKKSNGRRGTPDQNSVHTTTKDHGSSNNRDINGH